MSRVLIIVLIIVSMLSFTSCRIGLEYPILGAYVYTRHTNVEVPKKVIPIWIDVSFGEADLLTIDNAIMQWNYVLNGEIVLKIVDTKFDMEIWKINQQMERRGWLIIKIDSNNRMVPTAAVGYQTVGFADHVNGSYLYLIRDQLKGNALYGVTLHEIGHLLGSEHIKESRLMYPYYSEAGYQCIDRLVAEEVGRVNGISGLNYCIDIGWENEEKGPRCITGMP